MAIELIKITQLDDIGANLNTQAVMPIVNLVGTTVTNKVTVGNLANLMLSNAGVNYPPALQANVAYFVTNNNQPNITNVGTLTTLTVSGNVSFGPLLGLAVVGTANFTQSNVQLGSVSNITITGGTAGQILSTDGTGNLSWVNDANSSYGNGNVANYLPTFTGNLLSGNANLGNAVVANYFIGDGSLLAGVTSYSNSNAVAYGEAGWSGNIIPSSNAIYSLGNSSNQWMELWVSNSTIYIGGVPLAITTGNILTVGGQPLLSNDSNTSIATTGNITADIVTATSIIADNIGNIASINLSGNSNQVLSGNGTWVAQSEGGANTGNVTFEDQVVIGTGDEYGGGGLYLAPGTNSTANLQYFRVRGGDYPTHIHFDTGNNNYFDQYFGDDDKFVKLEASSQGNIVIGTQGISQNYNWTFTSDGNLILANGLSIIQSIANSSLDPMNPNVSTMVLTPDQNYSSQALVLDPTAPGHIHLRAPSGIGNIDNPAANLFLGGEASSFEIGASYGDFPNVYVHSNNYTWEFGNDGNLTLPGTPGRYIKGPEGGYAGLAVIDDGTDLPAQLVSINSNSGIGTTAISAYANNALIQANINGDIKTWAFDNTGNLTLPGNTFAVNYANGIQVSLGGGNYDDSNVANFLSNFGSNIISTTGNITAGNIIGNISITGNVTGTSPNVSLVAGNFTATFDNTGILTLPTMGGDEGGEINLGVPATNTTLTTRVVVDVYRDRFRIFDGSTKGVYIDLSQADTGVNTLLNNRVSAYVNAGVFVTMDNIKATVTTSGNRGLSLATVSGSFNTYIAGNFNSFGAGNGGSVGTTTITTTPSVSVFGWGFNNQGDTVTYIVNDTTNNRCYRITLQVGDGWLNNMISIERLI